MPKGEYVRSTWGDAWTKEQDEWLEAQCKTAKSYRVLAEEFNAAFPGSHKSRSAILGRASRMGYNKDKPLSANGAKYNGRIAAMKQSRVKGTGATRASRMVAKKDLAPVTFKDPVGLRAEHEPTLRRSGPHRSRFTPEAIAEARRGRRISIIEEKPLTSVPFLSANADRCKWPTSEDVRCMEVCGAEATHGAYCERHARVAYTDMPTAKRNRAYSKRGLIETARARIQDEDAQWIADNVLTDEVLIAGDAPLMIEHFVTELDE